ncbi:MAG: 50S ribosomal protein L4 [Ilumatobacteraceae bacterium]|nr:50S ribosomal protein L4 [Ilumatobacteraceae bacterium]
MSSVSLKTAAGKDAGSLELDAEVFGIQPNVPVMHQVVTAQLAARRSGTQSTKTRAEVSGGGKKPFKQKGTGNARQGSTRAPHFSGGGVALGPKPRKYDQKTPKKMIKLALRSALSDRAAEGKVVVIEAWNFETPKTKDAKAALSALGITGKALVVVDGNETNAIRSFLNLPEVQLIEINELNAYDILCNDYIIFSQATLPGTSVAAAAPAPKKAAAKKAAAAKAEAPAKVAALVAEEVAEPVADAASTIAPATADLPKGAAAANEDGSGPEGYDIKGNADSGLYHVPGSSFYDRTEAELWFATAEDAQAAGFQLPPSQRKKADAADAADESSQESN